MNLDDLRHELASIESTISLAQKKAERLKAQYLKENAKFKVGDRVYCTGWWMYGPHDDSGHNKWIDEMYGTITEAARLGHRMEIWYAVEPDQTAYWRGHYRVARDESSLTPVSQVVIS